VGTRRFLDINRLMEAAFHQGLDPALSDGARERGEESVPFGRGVGIGWQAEEHPLDVAAGFGHVAANGVDNCAVTAQIARRVMNRLARLTTPLLGGDLDELGLDRDVAVRCPGIRTHLVRRLDHALRDVGGHAGEADVEESRDIVAFAVRSEIDLGIERPPVV
jgi:hypothetical protein